ncbi:MAG: hypothetical protein ACTSRU_05155 [Candidatus Hodarchaeales archaeon]
MKNSRKVILVIITNMILLSTIETASWRIGEDAMYEVEEGDKKTFYVTHFDYEGNDTYEIQLFDGRSNITLVKGSEFVIEITNMPDYVTDPQTTEQIVYKVTIKDSISGIQVFDDIIMLNSFWVIPTTENRSYWEERIEISKESDEFEENYGMFLEGSLFVYRSKYTIYDDKYVEIYFKWSIMTGWLEYFHLSGYANVDNDGYVEVEILADTYEPAQAWDLAVLVGELSIAGLVIITTFISASIIAIVVKRLQHK